MRQGKATYTWKYCFEHLQEEKRNRSLNAWIIAFKKTEKNPKNNNKKKLNKKPTPTTKHRETKPAKSVYLWTQQGLPSTHVSCGFNYGICLLNLYMLQHDDDGIIIVEKADIT